jgi:hypothetical protein
VALVAVLAWSLYPALRLQYIASRSLDSVQQQYASLTKDKESLRSQVTDLQTPKGVEDTARKDLGYAKKGESVYVVVPAGEPSGAAWNASGVTTASTADVTAPSLLQQLLDLFFGFQQASPSVAP